METLIRLRQEDETKALAERQRRAKEAEDDKYMKTKKSERDMAAENSMQADYAIKSQMGLMTKVQAAEEAKKQNERAMRGEKERKFTERSRQEREDELARLKELDKEEEKKLFRMDEAARAEYRAGKQAKKQLRRKQGVDRMKQQEEERKMLEKMEKDRMEADKKAFRAKTRAKAAEKEVLKEAAARAEEERLAYNAEFDATRAIADMKLAKTREASAEETLQKVTARPSKPTGNSPARTEYEVSPPPPEPALSLAERQTSRRRQHPSIRALRQAPQEPPSVSRARSLTFSCLVAWWQARMRKTYGTPGSADNIDASTALAFINN